MQNPIFIFSGAPASGKTTVSKALLQEFAFGLHIPVDTLRNWVVSDLSDPIGSWDAETERQFKLAREAAAATTKTYAKAGFAVAIDDLILPEQAETHYDKISGGNEVYKILLKPSLEVVLARNAHRQDPNQQVLEEVIEAVYQAFAQEAFNWTKWIIIDSSHLSVEETVEAILEQV